jgi:hypothetical protein
MGGEKHRFDVRTIILEERQAEFQRREMRISDETDTRHPIGGPKGDFE